VLGILDLGARDTPQLAIGYRHHPGVLDADDQEKLPGVASGFGADQLADA